MDFNFFENVNDSGQQQNSNLNVYDVAKVGKLINSEEEKQFEIINNLDDYYKTQGKHNNRDEKSENINNLLKEETQPISNIPESPITLPDLPDELLDYNENNNSEVLEDLYSYNENTKMSNFAETGQYFLFENELQSWDNKNERCINSLTVDIKRPLKAIPTSKHVERLNNHNSNETNTVVNGTNPLSNSFNEISKNNKTLEAFDIVEVVHHGKFDFDVSMNSIRVENNNGAENTVIQVKIPKNVGSLDLLNQKIYAHLYSKENRSG